MTTGDRLAGAMDSGVLAPNHYDTYDNRALLNPQLAVTIFGDMMSSDLLSPWSSKSPHCCLSEDPPDRGCCRLSRPSRGILPFKLVISHTPSGLPTLRRWKK
jgi:hypothetical protein